MFIFKEKPYLHIVCLIFFLFHIRNEFNIYFLELKYVKENENEIYIKDMLSLLTCQDLF